MNEVIVVNGKRGRGRPKSGKVLFAQRVSPELAGRLAEMVSEEKGRPVVVREAVTGGLAQPEAIWRLKLENDVLKAELALKAKESGVVVPVGNEAKLREELKEAELKAWAAVEENQELGERIVRLEMEVEELRKGIPDMAFQRLRAQFAEVEKKLRDKESDGS